MIRVYPRLAVRDLTFGYTAKRLLFDGWSQSFPAGEMTAVVGSSGRGKSTLLYLLGLMVRPTDGSVLVDGVDHARASDRKRAEVRARHFGFVFQDAALDTTRSVLDNIVEAALYRAQPRSQAVRRARNLLDAFDLDIEETARPGQISGGQAQRIALCRAMLARPGIVLADEPTGNLDAAAAGVVVDALRAAASDGAAVVVVTHSQEVAAQCDRTVRL